MRQCCSVREHFYVRQYGPSLRLSRHKPQSGVGGRIAQIEAEGGVEALAMDANELMHLPIGIGAGDDRQDRIEQHGRQLEPPALPAPMIRYLAQNLQER